MARQETISGQEEPLEPAIQAPSLWRRLDSIQFNSSGNRLPHVTISFLGALLMLRWAQEVDAKAVNGLDAQSGPKLTRQLTWNSWSGLRGDQLITVVRTILIPRLETLSNGTQGGFLAQLLPVFKHLVLESPANVETLVQWAQEFDIETDSGRQATGEALSILIEHATRTRGEFVTPSPVADLMVNLLCPSLGERIYDPCFGSGGLLAAAAARLRDQAQDVSPERWAEIKSDSLFGTEIDLFAYGIGLARVVLAGFGEPKLQLANALESPMFQDHTTGAYDCVLAVPPWGPRARRTLASRFPVYTTNVETLFLQHVMASLRSGGRAVIALPEGVLFRTGGDQRVREILLREFCVEGVISLPAGAFRPYTGIKGSLVYFRRAPAKRGVRFSQVDDWVNPSAGNTINDDGNAALVHRVTQEFMSETSNGSFWETPIEILANKGWSLVAKPTGEELLSRSLKILQESAAEIPVRPLHEVAEVFPGISYGSYATTPHLEDPEACAGLLRVADVTPSGVKPPSIFLTQAGVRRAKSKHRLRAGDVIFTATGTIGRLGVVSDSAGAVGTLPAKNLVVIRSKGQMSPEFLKGLLNSDTYQEWFRGHAQGNVIQYLTAGTLKRLPVPVPEMKLQDRVVRQNIRVRSGSLAAIVRMLADNGGDDPIVTWLEESSNAQELLRPQEEIDLAPLLGSTARSIRELRNLVVHAGAGVRAAPDLTPWLIHLSEATEMLEGLNHVPPGSGRIAILDGAQLRLERAMALLSQAHPATAKLAEQATKTISHLIRCEADLLLKNVKLEFRVEPRSVAAETQNEIQVRVANLSPLALRNLSVSTSPDIGSSQVPYLPEGQEFSFPAQVPALTSTGAFRFRLRWTANRIDGQSISREVPLAVDVHSPRQTARPGELGTSPYIVGSPINREDMFFGRQDIIRRIRRQLSTGHRANVILLEGNRRTGKTSILTRLKAPEVLKGWIVVNCSFQGGEGHRNKAGLTSKEVFRLMARQIAWAANDAGFQVWLPDIEPFDSKKPFKVAIVNALAAAFNSSERPVELFELYLQTVLQAVKPRRLLLMLDEFDKLQEGIDTGITSPSSSREYSLFASSIPRLVGYFCGLPASQATPRRILVCTFRAWLPNTCQRNSAG